MMITKTNDYLRKKGKIYEVVIADENIFVICPVKYNKRKKITITNCYRPKIYANQSKINTLAELGFELI